MDWLEDAEMMRQWEEVSKEEKKIAARKMEGRSLQVAECKSTRASGISSFSDWLVHRKDGGESKQTGVQRHGRNGVMEEHRSRKS